MKLEPIANSLSEPILGGVSCRGLRVLVNPRPEFVGAFGALGTNFGSVDRVGNARGEPVEIDKARSVLMIVRAFTERRQILYIE